MCQLTKTKKTLVLMFIRSGEITALKERYGMKTRYLIPRDQAIKILALKEKYKMEW
jgi:hypothetical protein